MKREFILSTIYALISILIMIFVIILAKGLIIKKNVLTSKVEIIQTGSLKINSIPNAKIFINDKLIGESPIVIANLNPDKYVITLQQDNYTEFKTTAQIYPEKISELNIKLEQTIKKDPESAVNGEYLYKTENAVFYKTEAGIFRQSLKKQVITSLLPEPVLLTNLIVTEFIYKIFENNTKIILLTTNDLIIYDKNVKEQEIISITKEHFDMLNTMSIVLPNYDNFYVLNNSKLYLYDIKLTSSQVINIADSYNTIFLNDDNLYGVTKDKIIKII